MPSCNASLSASSINFVRAIAEVRAPGNLQSAYQFTSGAGTRHLDARTALRNPAPTNRSAKGSTNNLLPFGRTDSMARKNAIYSAVRLALFACIDVQPK